MKLKNLVVFYVNSTLVIRQVCRYLSDKNAVRQTCFLGLWAGCLEQSPCYYKAYRRLCRIPTSI